MGKEISQHTQTRDNQPRPLVIAIPHTAICTASTSSPPSVHVRYYLKLAGRLSHASDVRATETLNWPEGTHTSTHIWAERMPTMTVRNTRGPYCYQMKLKGVIKGLEDVILSKGSE